MTNRIHQDEDEDKALAAQAEAVPVKAELGAARKQLEALRQSADGAGALEVEIAARDEVPGRRRKLWPSEYAALRANLETNELIHPIVYRPPGSCRHEFVSGHTRCRCRFINVWRGQRKRRNCSRAYLAIELRISRRSNLDVA